MKLLLLFNQKYYQFVFYKLGQLNPLKHWFVLKKKKKHSINRSVSLFGSKINLYQIRPYCFREEDMESNRLSQQ